MVNWRGRKVLPQESSDWQALRSTVDKMFACSGAVTNARNSWCSRWTSAKDSPGRKKS